MASFFLDGDGDVERNEMAFLLRFHVSSGTSLSFCPLLASFGRCFRSIADVFENKQRLIRGPGLALFVVILLISELEDG